MGLTTFKKILFTIVIMISVCIFAPREYHKEFPQGSQLIYYMLIFLVLSGAGFVFSAIDGKDPKLTKPSPVFDQASSVVISLGLLLVPIYLLKPKLCGIALLIFVVELGLVVGKYAHSKKFFIK